MWWDVNFEYQDVEANGMAGGLVRLIDFGILIYDSKVSAFHWLRCWKSAIYRMIEVGFSCLSCWNLWKVRYYTLKLVVCRNLFFIGRVVVRLGGSFLSGSCLSGSFEFWFRFFGSIPSVFWWVFWGVQVGWLLGCVGVSSEVCLVVALCILYKWCLVQFWSLIELWILFMWFKDMCSASMISASIMGNVVRR